MLEKKMDLKELQEAFLNIESKSVSDLKKLFAELSELEKEVSQFRNNLHQIDNGFKAELINRLAANPSLRDRSLLESLASTLESFPVSCKKSLDDVDLANLFTLPSLTGKPTDSSIEELEKSLAALRNKEAEVSFVRRLIHGWLDILKNELERRLTKPETTIETILNKIEQILASNF